jgi:hypothetical protein
LESYVRVLKDWVTKKAEGLIITHSFFLFSGDTLGSIVYVPCEVLKQRMQVSLVLFPLLLFLILVSVFASL